VVGSAATELKGHALARWIDPLEGDSVTADTSPNPWATLDDLLGVEVAETIEDGIGPKAFYGRCSTEDNQDPETSRAWQLSNALKFVEPLGATVRRQTQDRATISSAAH
jgi:hypothetical protein